MITIYECKFEFDGAHCLVNVDSRENTGGLLNFIDGFWIDGSQNLATDHGDQKFWIPANRIVYIKKMTFEADEAA